MHGSRVGSRFRIAGCAALIAALGSFAVGCAAPRNHLHRRSSAGFERAVVLPLNLVAVMPRELREGSRRVDRALLGYLAERGKAVETIGTAEAYAAWRASEAECRSQGGRECDRFLEVARVMAQRLRRDRDYQTLIIPYLLVRNARCRWGTAAWDGVQRPVERTGAGFGPDGPLRIWGGRIRAASLKVFAFSVEGEKVFEGIGGLEVIDRVYGTDGPETIGYEVRENLLGDPVVVREGVELALERLVPRAKSRSRS